MPCSFTLAIPSDAGALAALATSVAEHLTAAHGAGHWSSDATVEEKHRAIATSSVLVARDDQAIVAALRLTSGKPAAIDADCFTPVERPIYLLDMAVAPHRQRHGIGRALLGHAVAFAREWPADAIRLDAYESGAGAGPFYAKCGFREVARRVSHRLPLIYFELLL